MPYMLERTNGTLVKEIELKIPRSDEKVTGEVRLHGIDDGQFPAIWYPVHGEWKIFLAGETAKRFLK